MRNLPCRPNKLRVLNGQLDLPLKGQYLPDVPTGRGHAEPWACHSVSCTCVNAEHMTRPGKSTQDRQPTNLYNMITVLQRQY